MSSLQPTTTTLHIQANPRAEPLSKRSTSGWTVKEKQQLCRLYYGVGPGAIPTGSWDQVIREINKSRDACKSQAKVLQLTKSWTIKNKALLKTTCEQAPKKNGIIETSTWEEIADKVCRHWIVCQAYAEQLGYAKIDIHQMHLPTLSPPSSDPVEYVASLDVSEIKEIDTIITKSHSVTNEGHKLWTFKEDWELFNHVLSGYQQTWRQFGATINRSSDSCTSRVTLLGLNKKWTGKEKKRLQQECENALNNRTTIKDDTWGIISRVVGHYWITCQLQAVYLGYAPRLAICR